MGVAADPGRSAGVEEDASTCSRVPLTLNLASTAGCTINVSDGCFLRPVCFPGRHIALPLE